MKMRIETNLPNAKTLTKQKCNTLNELSKIVIVI